MVTREIERELPENYVRKDDFKDVIREIRQDMKDGFNKMDATLGLIFKRLEQKEDK